MIKLMSNQHPAENLQTRWIIASTTGEFYGFLAVFISALIALAFSSAYPHTKLFLQIIVVGGAIEGYIVGKYQLKILKHELPKLNATKWINLTVLGRVLVWFFLINKNSLVSVYPTVGNALLSVTLQNTAANHIQNLAVYNIIVSLFAGLFLGYIFSMLQWLELGTVAKKSATWIIYNVFAWGVGFLFITTCFQFIAVTNALVFLFLSTVAFFIAGVVISMITSISLLHLKPR